MYSVTLYWKNSDNAIDDGDYMVMDFLEKPSTRKIVRYFDGVDCAIIEKDGIVLSRHYV